MPTLPDTPALRTAFVIAAALFVAGLIAVGFPSAGHSATSPTLAPIEQSQVEVGISRALHTGATHLPHSASLSDGRRPGPTRITLAERTAALGRSIPGPACYSPLRI